MSERKIARLFKKIFAVLMTLVLVIGMNGNQTVLKVRAEGTDPEPEPGIEFWFDDRGCQDVVAIGEKKVACGELVSATSGNTYTVQLTPPGGREDSTPIVMVSIYLSGADPIVYNSLDDGATHLTITNGAFDIVIPPTTQGTFEKAVVNIWWSEYDRAGGWYDESSGEGEYCIEVVRDGGFEAYPCVNNIPLTQNKDYFVLWEYEDEHGNWGGQKIILPRNMFEGEGAGVTIKFQPYDESTFNRLQVNYENPEDIGPEDPDWKGPYVLKNNDLSEGTAPSYVVKKADFNQWSYLNMEVIFDGGGPSFNVFYDDYLGEVDISGTGYDNPTKLGCGPVENFAFGETYTFTLLPPDNRKDMYIVEARIHNPEGLDTIKSNVRHYDEQEDEDVDPNLSISKDGQFTLTIPTEANFCGIDINIWWSEFDRIGGSDSEYCLQVRNDGRGEAYFDDNPYPTIWEYNGTDSATGNPISYGSQKFLIPKADFDNAVLKFSPYVDYSFREFEIELPGTPVRKEASDFTEGEPQYQLKASDFDEWGNLNASVQFDSNGQSGGDITVFYRIEGDGTVLFYPEFEPIDNNGWKVGSLESNEITINVSPYEGWTLSKVLIDNVDVINDVVGNQYSWTLHPGDNYVEVFFNDGSTPGPEPGGNNTPGEKLKGFIEEQRFLFGDWDKNSGVTTDDLKLGIAQQIFYPQFSDPRSRLRFQESYPEIDSYEELVSGITIGERDSSKDITAIGGNGTQYTIPAYKYTFTFTDENNSDRNVNAEGIAWLFEITDTSVYATDSVTNVLMEVTNENGESTFFLRNCKRESPDCIDPVTKEQSGEGAYCAVGDYKVVFDAEKNAYVRSVSIFGNGASLDNFLMTEDSEIEMCTFQGKNEDIARETGHLDCNIFGKFSFYQSSYTGMKIQGAGAAGNTPAWSFATDPIWGSDESSDTEKEAIVYFGNDQVAFKPITVNGVISTITELSLVDTSIPAGVIEIRPDGDTWYVEFNSNFYDKVEFAVTYETASGPKTEYIWVHRVGIDIQASNGGSAGDSTILMHGTENGPRYTFTETCETIVYATYYYPEDGGTDKLVDLYATITWKDGSVTKEIIRNDSYLHLDFHHDGLDGEHTDDVQSDDFILYKGSKAGAPQKIEVSAVVSGFESTTSFTGMRLGSGKGVCWNNNITN